MANNNGLITKSVRMVLDVRSVLGESSNKLSTLCKSTKINKWARYKPIEYNSHAPNRNPQEWSSDKWFRGPSNRCGVSMVIFDSVNGAINGFANGWMRIDVPTSYFRLLDFDNYHHTISPVLSFSANDAVVAQSEYLVPPVCQVIMNGSDKCVQLCDVAVSTSNSAINLDSWYFGVLFTNGSARGIVTSGTPFSSDAPSGSNDYGKFQRQVTIDRIVLTKGTYRMYPILCNTANVSKYVTSGDITGYQIVALPTAAKDLVVDSTTFMYLLSGTNTGNTLSGTEYRSTFDIKIDNKTNSSISNTSSVLKYRQTIVYDRRSSYVEYNYPDVTVSDWSVSANSSTTKQVTVTFPKTYDGYTVVRAFLSLELVVATGVTLNVGVVPMTAI